MSMYSYIELLRDSEDEEYQRFLKIRMLCEEAKVSAPTQVQEYFGGTQESDYPLRIDFKEPRKYSSACGDASGLEIDIADLPKGVKTIRFVNSY